MVLAANPNAWLLLRVYVSAPPWWMDQHPDEVCRFEGGTADMKDDRVRVANKRVPSMASQAWREATCDNLRRLVDYVQSQPLGQPCHRLSHRLGHHRGMDALGLPETPACRLLPRRLGGLPRLAEQTLRQ